MVDAFSFTSADKSSPKRFSTREVANPLAKSIGNSTKASPNALNKPVKSHANPAQSTPHKKSTTFWPISENVSSSPSVSIAAVIASKNPFAKLLNVSAVSPASQFSKNESIPFATETPRFFQSKFFANAFPPEKTVFIELATVFPRFLNNLGLINPFKNVASPVPNFSAFLYTEFHSIDSIAPLSLSLINCPISVKSPVLTASLNMSASFLIELSISTISNMSVGDTPVIPPPDPPEPPPGEPEPPVPPPDPPVSTPKSGSMTFSSSMPSV